VGTDYYDQRKKETKVSYLTEQLTKLGSIVALIRFRPLLEIHFRGDPMIILADSVI
jgi:hypothetical protein